MCVLCIHFFVYIQVRCVRRLCTTAFTSFTFVSPVQGPLGRCQKHRPLRSDSPIIYIRRILYYIYITTLLLSVVSLLRHIRASLIYTLMLYRITRARSRRQQQRLVREEEEEKLPPAGAKWLVFIFISLVYMLAVLKRILRGISR